MNNTNISSLNMGGGNNLNLIRVPSMNEVKILVLDQI